MLEKANSDLVRRQNRNLVVQALRSQGPMPRISLGKNTGLSLASITSITAKLLEEDFILSHIDAEVSPLIKRGRPLTNLSLNPDVAAIAVIVISVEGVVLYFADFCGVVFYTTVLSLDTYNATPAGFAPDLAQALKQHAKLAGIQLAQVHNIGVAIQGVADNVRGEITWSPVFQARNIPLAAPLTSALRIPCMVNNNANMVAAALLHPNRQRYSGTTAAIFLGHGIGMGLILDGKIFSGANGRAGEFGHMNHVPHNGQVCRCGMRGCLEAYAADYAILRQYHLKKGQSFDIHGAISDPDFTALIAAAQQGEADAVTSFHEAGQALGYGVSRLIATFNPNRIVLCGPGTRAAHLMQESMLVTLHNSMVAELYQSIEFEMAPFEDDMIVKGTIIETLRELDRQFFTAGAVHPVQDIGL